MCTWSRDVGRPPRGYQEGNLPGGEIIILQAAQGGEFTCWEGSAVSEMQSWSSRARAEELWWSVCRGAIVLAGKRNIQPLWATRSEESQIMTVLARQMQAQSGIKNYTQL